jgi:hypothetical protein
MLNAEVKKQDRSNVANALFLCTLAAVVMAYGWGFRGTTGGTRGAMAAGAMLGMALCLGSHRPDWQRRTAVAGLFGAVGWAWGGTFSYMEQTFYTVTDSFPDVLYGYSCLFLLGGLWAGIGGAILGLTFTLPRSQLQRFVGPFVAILLTFYLVPRFLSFADLSDPIRRFVTVHLPNANVFPPFLVVVVCGIYALVRPKERAESALFFACGLAWWVGYLSLIKVGGLALGPPYRLESWSGILGVLVMLIVYLVRQRNRAALMLCFYGIGGGGLAFALAVFVHHPIRVLWGPFAAWGGAMAWKIAEESFGLFMGLAIALGMARLIRGGLAPAVEDKSSRNLDVFAGFFMLVVVLWRNLDQAPIAWLYRFETVSKGPVAGLMTMTWFTIAGLILSALVIYGLYQYWHGTLSIAPPTPYGKGTLLLLLLIWTTFIAGSAKFFPSGGGRGFLLVTLSFVLLCAIATAMLLSRRDAPADAKEYVTANAPPTDSRWNVGAKYGLVWASVPLVLLCITSLSLAMQDGPADRARLRFGPNAYWREALSIIGRWEVQGFVASAGKTAKGSVGEGSGSGFDPGLAQATLTEREIEFQTIEFKRDHRVSLSLSTGEEVSNAHGWRHSNSRLWLMWHSRDGNTDRRASIHMTLLDGRLYIPWPSDVIREGYLALERQESQ